MSAESHTVEQRLDEVYAALQHLQAVNPGTGLLDPATNKPVNNFGDITMLPLEYICIVSYTGLQSPAADNRGPSPDLNTPLPIPELQRYYGAVSPYSVAATALRVSVRHVISNGQTEIESPQTYVTESGVRKVLSASDGAGYLAMASLIESAAKAVARQPIETPIHAMRQLLESGLATTAAPLATLPNELNRLLEMLYKVKKDTHGKEYICYELGIDETRDYEVALSDTGRPVLTHWKDTMLAATAEARDAKCPAVSHKVFGAIWRQLVANALYLPELVQTTLKTKP